MSKVKKTKSSVEATATEHIVLETPQEAVVDAMAGDTGKKVKKSKKGKK